MIVRALSPHIGVEICDVDACAATPDQAAEIARLLLVHGIVLFRQQTMTTAQQVAFSQLFGELETFPRAASDPPEDEFIFRVSNDKRRGYKGVGLYWHTDGYFHEMPTAVSIMRALEVPSEGGDTGFANMARAFVMLPADMRERIDGLVAVSRPAPGEPRGGLFSPETSAGVRHPLVRSHPLTRRPTLYLNVGNMAAVEGVARKDARALIENLAQHVENGDFTYFHRWAAGDLIMWDNAGVAHKATIPPAGTFRLMERTTLLGEEYHGRSFWSAAGEAAIAAL